LSAMSYRSATRALLARNSVSASCSSGNRRWRLVSTADPPCVRPSAPQVLRPRKLKVDGMGGAEGRRATLTRVACDSRRTDRRQCGPALRESMSRTRPTRPRVHSLMHCNRNIRLDDSMESLAHGATVRLAVGECLGGRQIGYAAQTMESSKAIGKRADPLFRNGGGR
jgi:hypothetical protein